jgi:hypothetical protein
MILSLLLWAAGAAALVGGAILIIKKYGIVGGLLSLAGWATTFMFSPGLFEGATIMDRSGVAEFFRPVFEWTGWLSGMVLAISTIYMLVGGFAAFSSKYEWSWDSLGIDFQTPSNTDWLSGILLWGMVVVTGGTSVKLMLDRVFFAPTHFINLKRSADEYDRYTADPDERIQMNLYPLRMQIPHKFIDEDTEKEMTKYSLEVYPKLSPQKLIRIIYLGDVRTRTVAICTFLQTDGAEHRFRDVDIDIGESEDSARVFAQKLKERLESSTVKTGKVWVEEPAKIDPATGKAYKVYPPPPSVFPRSEVTVNPPKNFLKKEDPKKDPPPKDKEKKDL